MAQTPNQHQTAPLLADTPPQLTPQHTFVNPGLGQSPGLQATPHHSCTQPASVTVSPLQLAGLDPFPATPQQTEQRAPRMLTTHQVKSVATFTGKERHGPRVQDWIRDMRYLLQAKEMVPGPLEFQEVVRHTSGRARDVLLNLERRTPSGLNAEGAFSELLEEYGDDKYGISPEAKFYSRVQRAGESATEYAISLEATLREVEETRQRQGLAPDEQREKKLTTQFMYGLRDLHLRARLAPMQPRFMAFRDLRRELHIIAEEERQAEDIRRKTSLFVMSEAATSTPQQAPGGKAPNRMAPEKSTLPEPQMNEPQSIQKLMAQQLEEMRAMHHGQMEALDRVLEQQHQHSQRLTRLETVVFHHQSTHQNQAHKQPYTGCFNCGDRRHRARDCPRSNHTERSQPAVNNRQMSAPPATPTPLNEQNLPQ